MNYEDIEDVIRKENESKEECICEWCNKPILFAPVNKTDILYNGRTHIVNNHPYHTICNKLYECHIKENQLRNVLHIIFDEKTDIVNIVPVRIPRDDSPIWFHVNTLQYSFFIGIRKKSDYPFIIDLSNFPTFTDTFEDKNVSLSKNGNIRGVYAESYTDLISVFQRVIQSIILKNFP